MVSSVSKMVILSSESLISSALTAVSTAAFWMSNALVASTLDVASLKYNMLAAIAAADSYASLASQAVLTANQIFAMALSLSESDAASFRSSASDVLSVSKSFASSASDALLASKYFALALAYRCLNNIKSKTLLALTYRCLTHTIRTV